MDFRLLLILGFFVAILAVAIGFAVWKSMSSSAEEMKRAKLRTREELAEEELADEERSDMLAALGEALGEVEGGSPQEAQLLRALDRLKPSSEEIAWTVFSAHSRRSEVKSLLAARMATAVAGEAEAHADMAASEGR